MPSRRKYRPIPPRRGKDRRSRPGWARHPRPGPEKKSRDWIQISVAALPGLAAVIALAFTWQSINATNVQLQITEQGQITDRYNAAITNLGSPAADVRLGGIYALQRIMRDSPRDQPTVVAVLCAFVRDHVALPPGSASAAWKPTKKDPAATDVEAALTVVGQRNTAHDGDSTVVDLSNSDLRGADLADDNLDGADLTGAHLDGADLGGVDLRAAHLTSAHLTGAHLTGAHLTGAIVNDADLTGALLPFADLTDATLDMTTLRGADLTGAIVNDALLNGADLRGAHLEDAELDHAQLYGAHLDIGDAAYARKHGAVNVLVGSCDIADAQEKIARCGL